MIYGIIGDKLYSKRQKRGNGKTLTMTALCYLFGHLQGLPCYFNYNTTFGEKITVEEFYELFAEGEMNNAYFGIDEIQVFIDSHAGFSVSKTKGKIYDMALQTRKGNINLFWVTQREENVHKVLYQQTDYFIEPKKMHIDEKGNAFMDCNFEQLDLCSFPVEQHIIRAYFIYPYVPIYFDFKVSEFGHLYNTSEIIKRHEEKD